MQRTYSNEGFTLFELVVIVAILGVIAAIAAPSWINLLTRQRLYNARANALDKIREAQSQAIRTSRPWEACFRDRNGFVEVSVQPGGRAYNCRNHTSWRALMEGDIRTVAIKTNETAPTNIRTNIQGNRNDGFSFRFGAQGNTTGLGASGLQIVFIPRGQPRGPYYCVYTNSIIGQFQEGSIRSGTMCR